MWREKLESAIFDRTKGSVQIALDVVRILDEAKGKVDERSFAELVSFVRGSRKSMTAISGLLDVFLKLKSYREVERYVESVREEIARRFVAEVEGLKNPCVAVASYSSLVKFCLSKLSNPTLCILPTDRFALKLARELSADFKLGLDGADFALIGADGVWMSGGTPRFVVNGKPSLDVVRTVSPSFCVAESFKFCEGEPYAEEGFDIIPADLVRIISDRS